MSRNECENSITICNKYITILMKACTCIIWNDYKFEDNYWDNILEHNRIKNKKCRPWLYEIVKWKQERIILKPKRSLEKSLCFYLWEEK